MSVTILIEAKIKDNEAFDALLLKELPATRSYDGCEGLTVHRNVDDPSNAVVVEQWETRDHYNKYLSWREETGVLAQLLELCDGEPSIRCYTTVRV